MNKLLIFTDGSVNTQSKIGYGAYLALSDFDVSIDVVLPLVKLKRFEHTSSTKLELQTFLWALGENNVIGRKVIVYTDSQNILSLLGRRERFEKNNYSTKKNLLINNHELYKSFYKITDQVDCEIVKVQGHKASVQKEFIDTIFSLVDKASRNALRKDNS